MQGIFESINGIFAFIGPLSDFLWDFPTNFEWYASIPLLGNFSFAIILLLGSGIFFSFRIGFMQVTHFKKGVQIMTEKRAVSTGISPLAAFLLSSAMRVGPGNIIGVTGAIAVGGPGALFWMWISAFFGMAVAYMEGVLAQIFKEKKENEFVGGCQALSSGLHPAGQEPRHLLKRLPPQPVAPGPQLFQRRTLHGPAGPAWSQPPAQGPVRQAPAAAPELL